MEESIKPRISYSEIEQIMNPAPTPQQRQESERRRRSTMLVSALGDGLNALASVYFASKGANPTFKAKDGLLPSTIVDEERRQQREERQEQERQRRLRQAYARDHTEAERQQRRVDADRRQRISMAIKARRQHMSMVERVERDALRRSEQQRRQQERQQSAQRKATATQRTSHQGEWYFRLSDAEGVWVPKGALNEVTVSQMFDCIPADERRRLIATYGDGRSTSAITRNVMLRIIGAYARSSQEMRDALRNLGR